MQNLTIIIFLSLFLTNLTSEAAQQVNKVSPILKCLGQEELIIHKKKSEGPIYSLNKIFINELSSANLVVTDRFLKKICHSKDFAPSVELLYNLLIYGTSIFKKNPAHETINYQISSIARINDNISTIFFNYISSLQQLAPTPKCLEKYIPPLDKLMKRFKVLEGDFSSRSLLSDKKQIKEIFKKLKNLDQIIMKCQKDKKNSKTKKR